MKIETRRRAFARAQATYIARVIVDTNVIAYMSRFNIIETLNQLKGAIIRSEFTTDDVLLLEKCNKAIEILESRI